jgi:WD40 repeat protein/serine/threonine protein kinase
MKTDRDISAGAREREVFLRALERTEPRSRAAYLDEACAGDRELRRRVEELLLEQEEVGEFLEQPAMRHSGRTPGGDSPAQGDTAGVATVTEKPGDRIGRYKLLQQIGEGGCGVVYMAGQEEPVRRRVALKIIKLGMDTRQVIARFEAERQALAMMDHPNIAKVLDAGATETGRPFFVMELVRGVRITDYCDQNNLSTEARLELFVQVCQAIQHAHQKGIIHRDIKPSNILVTLHDGTPVPKVIDFGVAKATNHQRLTDKTVFTAFEQFIGTPAYMSPEQAEMSGLDIDTRSDIYSLGVLLYELLTGKTPFDPQALVSAGLDECRRTIRLEEPARPSNRLATMLEADLTTTANRRGTEAPKLIHTLRGDLDWVVMMCLEKDRTRRYATANALATDVERYLEGEPVLARPPSTVYRFEKFVRRHAGAFAAASAIAVILLAGATLSAWLAIRARKAEAGAQAAQHQEALLRRQAENGWERAREKGALARLNEYVADVNLAHNSLLAGNYGRAVQLLNKHRPQAGEKDLRGFEWRYLWGLCEGDNHVALPSQEGAVQALAYAPGGEHLAVVLRDRVNIWDPRHRSLATTLTGGFNSVVFSPDGRTLYTASPESRRGPPGDAKESADIRAWNTAAWSERRVGRGGSGPIALSSDGRRLASSGRQGVRVWDTSSWAETGSVPEARVPLAFSPDGGLLATDGREGITLWPQKREGPPVVLQGSSDMNFMGGPWFAASRVAAFSPDGRVFAMARNSRTEKGVFVIGLWDAVTGQEVATMPEDPEHIEHTGMISSLAFSPDGRTLATSSMDHSVRLWNLASHRCTAVLQGHLNEVWTAAFSPDGLTLASGAKDGGLKLWQTHRQSRDDSIPDVVHPLAFSSDGRTLAALGAADKVLFIDPATRQAVREFQLEESRRFRFGPRVSLSQDLRVMAEAREGGLVRLWNTATREYFDLEAGEREIGFVLLSPSGRDLVTSGFGHPMRWWNIGSGINSVIGKGADRALFSPDGRTLATFGRDARMEFWDTATRTLQAGLELETSPGFTAAFSPNGRLLAVAGGPNEVEQAIQLWDVAGGKLLGTCAGHKQLVWSVAFSADGRTLASASDDSTVKLWNVASQQELLSIRRLGGALRGLLFSPDGRLLVGVANRSAEAGGLQIFRARPLSDIDPGMASAAARR